MNTRNPSRFGATCRPLIVAIGLAAVALGTTTASASVAFASDFEALSAAAPTALSGSSWKVFGNVFNGTGGYIRGYGPYPAPNNGSAFSNVTSGEGGPDQGAQGLVIYSDYNNQADQTAGNRVEANVYQEFTIAEEDIGFHVFRFDAKRGNLASPSSARAFVKVLDPGAGYATSEYLFIDTSNLPVEWGTYSISIEIHDLLVGQILQFGFAATASNNTASGVHYDNVAFEVEAPAPPVITAVTKSGNLVNVTFLTEVGALYDLVKSTDNLVSFNLVATQPVIIGDGTPKTATDNAAIQPSAFYRIRRQE